MAQNYFENIETKETAPAELEITGEIPVAVLSEYRPRVIKQFTESLEVPGFRKGHVPEKIAVERVGEVSILHEVAEAVLKRGYPELVRERELQVIGRPEVSLTKLAPGNPVGFSIKTALYPTITLPDYKVIAEERGGNTEPIFVADEEVEQGIKSLLAQFGKAGQPAAETAQADAGETDAKDTPVPELTDELVKQWGDFENVADFKKKFKESITLDKERKAREKTRLNIAEAIIEKSEVAMPRILVESELGTMFARLRGDIERLSAAQGTAQAGMGHTFDDYLKQIGKTEEDLRKEWEPEAEKRAKLQLILNEIAKQEKLMPDPQTVEKEAERMKAQMSAEGNTETPMDRIRDHVALMLMNENVFRFLEEQHKKETSDQTTKKTEPEQKEEDDTASNTKEN